MSSVDPIIWFFLFGVIAGLLKSELRMPPQVYALISMLLLLTIGMKGGVELAAHNPSTLLPQIVIVGLSGFILPLIVYPFFRYLGRFSRPDAASLAAHYGSVSVGTFAVAVSYLSARSIGFEPQMALFVVVLEIPAILVGIVLAKGLGSRDNWKPLAHEVFLGKGVVLLLGGLFIGWASGEEGISSISPLFFDLFKGILALFLLEMGLIAASQANSLIRFGLPLLILGIAVPLLFSIIGLLVGNLIDLSVGGVTVLATLFASASYIAVPAAMRISVPEANPTLSLTASLGVTFPFNIIVGIPIYLSMAQKFA